MKHNSVFMYGQVVNSPRIFRNNDGEFVKGICSVNIIRGTRDYGDNSYGRLKYDVPIVMSGNPEIVKEMATWKEYDMVEIKGAITTKEVNKSTICKVCGHKDVLEGNVIFVNPIYASLRETGITKEEGLELLKKRCEISNMVTVIGTLCREPETYTSKKVTITQYNLAVMRKFRIREHPDEERTDFPWVKSYGKNAIDDAKALRLNSKVFVDGHLQARTIERKTTCSKCGHVYSWEDNALEIVPYAVEYLQDFNTLKEIEEKESEEAEKLADQILS